MQRRACARRVRASLGPWRAGAQRAGASGSARSSSARWGLCRRAPAAADERALRAAHTSSDASPCMSSSEAIRRSRTECGRAEETGQGGTLLELRGGAVPPASRTLTLRASRVLFLKRSALVHCAARGCPQRARLRACLPACAAVGTLVLGLFAGRHPQREGVTLHGVLRAHGRRQRSAAGTRQTRQTRQTRGKHANAAKAANVANSAA